MRKVWNDRNDSDGKRPEAITVKLLRDGVVFEEVKLNESNKWAHSWTGLSSAHQWAVVEASVPSGYTTLSDVEGDTTTITNTHTPPRKPPPAHTGSAVQSVADGSRHLRRSIGTLRRSEDREKAGRQAVA